jgi:hypothetical protein
MGAGALEFLLWWTECEADGCLCEHAATIVREAFLAEIAPMTPADLFAPVGSTADLAAYQSLIAQYDAERASAPLVS